MRFAVDRVAQSLSVQSGHKDDTEQANIVVFRGKSALMVISAYMTASAEAALTVAGPKLFNLLAHERRYKSGEKASDYI